MTTEAINELRQRTGAPVLACKRALDTAGNVDGALELISPGFAGYLCPACRRGKHSGCEASAHLAHDPTPCPCARW